MGRAFMLVKGFACELRLAVAVEIDTAPGIIARLPRSRVTK